MICAIAQRPFSDFSRSIDDAAMERRLPYCGCLELTYRCNLACRHCYCNLSVADPRGQQEMGLAQIKRIIDEAAAAGCLWMLLTGGEVLLREDFGDVYEHALRAGMLVEVFTNATLIDEATARFFSDCPPLGLDISIYGATPQIHDLVTGVPGSFERTMRGIGFLRTCRVPFSLKTVLMTINVGELAGMRRLAAGLGAKFRFDTLVCPRTDGGTAALQYRLDARTMARFDLEEDFRSCRRLFEGFWNKKPQEALTCGGGVFAFNVNPYGVLSPCTMFRSFQHPIGDRAFAGVWKELVDEHEAKKEELTAARCRGCSMQLLCSNCPAWSEIETGSMQGTVEYVCAYAKTLEKEYFAHKEAGHGKEALQKAGT